MNFTSTINVDPTHLDYFQSTTQVGLAAFTTALLGVLAFFSYTPRVHPKSPPFTSHTNRFIGSWGFVSEQW